MSDLIDRQAAYDAIMREGRNVDSRYLESERIIHECDAVEAISMLPTIDAVEVVRCKECINFTRGKDEWGSCFENPMKMWRDTDYCSWGERRTDAN